MTRPRLRDVAELAKVSEPTVSRVLNGRSNVASGTRQRVVDALKALGYDDVPEAAAGSGRKVVGLVCGEFTNPVFPTLSHHIAHQLGRLGYLTTVAVHDPTLTPEERCLRELSVNGVDAIVCVAGRHAEVDASLDHYQDVLDKGIPLVFVNGRHTELDIPHVRCDEGIGAVKAVNHLLGLGHTRVGLLLGPHRYVPTPRFIAGYRQVMTDAGLGVDDADIAETVFTLEGGRTAAARLLRRGVTGILAGNDLMALGAVQAAENAGLSVPGELSVVGYDGTDYTALTAPPLTTLRQPFEDMASLVAHAVESEIQGRGVHRDHYVFEPQLIARDSSGACRTVVDRAVAS